MKANFICHRYTSGFSVLMAAILAACGTLVGNPEEDGSGKSKPKPATAVVPVVFSIADAPLDEAQSVLITIEAVEVTTDGDRWLTIPLKQAAEVDLMKYQDGNSLPFAEAPALPEAVYQKTRFKLLSSATPKIVLVDGSSHDLEIQAEDKEIVILNPFNAEAGKPARLTIDFDLRKSIKKVKVEGANLLDNGKGNSSDQKSDTYKYVMKPVLRMIRDEEAGAISGVATSGKTVCVYPKDSDKDTADDCANSANSATVKDGHYKVGYLPAGDYEVRVFDDAGNVKDVTAIHVEQGKATEIDHE